MKTKITIFVITCALFAGCCKDAARKDQSDAQEDFRALLEAHKFHEAFLLFPKVEEQMKDVQEDAVGFEYQTLMDTTAGTGRKEWDEILNDPRISSDMKRDLRDEIREEERHSKQ